MGRPWGPDWRTLSRTRRPAPGAIESLIPALFALGSGLAEEERSRIGLEVVGQQAHRARGSSDLLETSIELVDRGRVVDCRLGLPDGFGGLFHRRPCLGGGQVDISGYTFDVDIQCGRQSG